MSTSNIHLGKSNSHFRQEKVLLMKRHICQSELDICSAPMPSHFAFQNSILKVQCITSIAIVPPEFLEHSGVKASNIFWHYEISHVCCKKFEETATCVPVYHVSGATDNLGLGRHRTHLPTQSGMCHMKRNPS